MLKKVLLGLAVLLVVGVGVAVFWIGPANVVGMIVYGTQRREGTLQPGDRAPDVALVSLDGDSRRRLGELVGERPLVLVFGSFT
jgi:hypothetical protein